MMVKDEMEAYMKFFWGKENYISKALLDSRVDELIINNWIKCGYLCVGKLQDDYEVYILSEEGKNKFDR